MLRCSRHSQQKCCKLNSWGLETWLKIASDQVRKAWLTSWRSKIPLVLTPHQPLDRWPQLVPAWDEEALLVSMGPTKLPVEKASSRRVCINGGRPGWPTTFIYTQCAFLLCAFIQCVFLQCDQPPWCASTMCFLQCVFQKKKKITFLASPLQCISGMFEVFNKHLEILWYFSIQYRGGRSKW